MGYADREKLDPHEYEANITCDTAADIPDPAENPQWAAGSWLHVLEGGGSLYTLGTDRVWHPQGLEVQSDEAV